MNSKIKIPTTSILTADLPSDGAAYIKFESKRLLQKGICYSALNTYPVIGVSDDNDAEAGWFEDYAFGEKKRNAVSLSDDPVTEIIKPPTTVNITNVKFEKTYYHARTDSLFYFSKQPIEGKAVNVPSHNKNASVQFIVNDKSNLIGIALRNLAGLSKTI